MHNIPDFLRITPEMQQHFKKGGMIKRADGSYSRRGLWDNIRANKGSGRKPTKEMLEQEAKIRAEEQYGGTVDEFGKGGYTVKRSSARKGKTHVVIGPDGTKKYFGDSKLGQHPKDPERKKAFYARHKHNLANNPYFRAFARATWETGGPIPTYASGTASVDPSQLSQDQLTNWNRFQYYASNNANITDPAYNTDRQKGYDLLNQYNQANPNNQVPTDSIPTYQAYFQKLQAGQTNVGQAGQQYVQKNFTQGVSPQDAFIGTQTLGSRVPMRGKKTVTNANTGQVVYNSGARPSTALPTPTPSQPVAQTTTVTPVPGMESATLAYGGYFEDGGNYGAFYGRRDAAKMQGMFNPTANSMTPSFFANGGLTKYQTKGFVDDAEGTSYMTEETANSGKGINNSGFSNNPFIMGAINNAKNALVGNQNQIINGAQGPTATNMLTGQSANQTMMDQGQDDLANDDFQLPTIMGNEGFGQNIKLNSPQQPVATNATPATTTPAATAPGTTAVETPEQKAAREKAERAKRGSQIARGAGLAGLGAIGLAKELTTVGPKSQETAILDFTTQSLGNSVNRLAVREQNKGIAYGKHGGKIIDKYGSYSEGDIIEDITPTERYALEKLGYKFQIL